MKKAAMSVLIAVLFSIVMFSCGTNPPEGFEAAEQKAMDAQAKALEAGGKDVMSLEYEAADSVLKTALSEKEQKNYENSMELFNQAEEKFIFVVKMVPVKLETEDVMGQAQENIKKIDENLEGGNQ